MKCPKCPNVLFRDQYGDLYCLCGYRPPIEPFSDVQKETRRPATHAHKTLERYNDLKREARQRRYPTCP